MSSILKALKKLEDADPVRRSSQSWTKKINTKKAMNKGVKGPWLFKRVISFLCLLILLFCGWWLIYNHRSLFMEIIYSTGNNSQESSVKGTDNKSTSIRKWAVKKQASVTEKKAATQKQVGNPERSISEKISNQQDNDSWRTSNKEGTPPKGREPGIKRQPAPAKKIDRARFKLEAIVWSDNPKSRFAVINGRIVRAGSTIDGVSVSRIGREHVALHSGDDKFNLGFTVE